MESLHVERRGRPATRGVGLRGRWGSVLRGGEVVAPGRAAAIASGEVPWEESGVEEGEEESGKEEVLAKDALEHLLAHRPRDNRCDVVSDPLGVEVASRPFQNAPGELRKVEP